MWPAHTPASSAKGDDLCFFDALAIFDKNFTQMAVLRVNACAVVDDDAFTTIIKIFCDFYDACVASTNLLWSRGFKICPAMKAF